jgi:hypothetical protein
MKGISAGAHDLIIAATAISLDYSAIMTNHVVPPDRSRSLTALPFDRDLRGVLCRNEQPLIRLGQAGGDDCVGGIALRLGLPHLVR